MNHYLMKCSVTVRRLQYLLSTIYITFFGYLHCTMPPKILNLYKMLEISYCDVFASTGYWLEFSK